MSLALQEIYLQNFVLSFSVVSNLNRNPLFNVYNESVMENRKPCSIVQNFEMCFICGHYLRFTCAEFYQVCRFYIFSRETFLPISFCYVASLISLYRMIGDFSVSPYIYIYIVRRFYPVLSS